MRDAFRVWITIDVRWGDMDAFGHVNNAKFFTFCESARIRYFDELGLDNRSAAPDGADASPYGPAVVTATCNFQRQVHYPATLDVGARVTHIGRTSFTLDYILLRQGTDEVVADGSSVVVWVDYREGKSASVPEELKARIREIDREVG